MLSRQKRYVGKLPTEEAAARFYDKVSIQYQGDLAKTNFPYTKRQVMRLLRAKPLLEWENLIHLRISDTQVIWSQVDEYCWSKLACWEENITRFQLIQTIII